MCSSLEGRGGEGRGGNQPKLQAFVAVGWEVSTKCILAEETYFQRRVITRVLCDVQDKESGHLFCRCELSVEVWNIVLGCHGCSWVLENSVGVILKSKGASPFRRGGKLVWQKYCSASMAAVEGEMQLIF